MYNFVCLFRDLFDELALSLLLAELLLRLWFFFGALAFTALTAAVVVRVHLYLVRNLSKQLESGGAIVTGVKRERGVHILDGAVIFGLGLGLYTIVKDFILTFFADCLARTSLFSLGLWLR